MGKQWWLSEAFYKYTWRTWRYIMSKYRTVPFQEPCRFLWKSFDQNKSFWKMVYILSMFILYSAHVSIIKRATRSSGNQCLFCFSSIRFSHVKVSSKGGGWCRCSLFSCIPRTFHIQSLLFLQVLFTLKGISEFSILPTQQNNITKL